MCFKLAKINTTRKLLTKLQYPPNDDRSYSLFSFSFSKLRTRSCMTKNSCTVTLPKYVKTMLCTVVPRQLASSLAFFFRPD